MDLARYAQKTNTTPAQFRLALQKHGVDVSHQAVMMWFHGTRKPSPKHMPAIEAATDGMVTRYHQRPDVFGPAPKRQRKAA